MANPHRILAGMVVGVGLGLAAKLGLGPGTLAFLSDTVAYFVGQLFLRLVFMAVIPLVVASLVLGVFQLGDLGRVGRIGLRCLALTLAFSSTSVLVGLGMVALLSPGAAVDQATRDELVRSGAKDSARAVESAAQAARPVDALLGLIPKNPFKAAVEPDMLALMVFAVMIGVALTTLEAEKVEPVVRLAEAVLAVSMRFIDWAMALAPVAVAAMLFTLTVKSGIGLFKGLAWYAVAVVGGLSFQLLVVYSLALTLVAGISPPAFFRSVREAMLTAFSTASSSATLPVSLRVSEEQLGIPRQVGSFVLTVGATANQNGTALYEGVTVLFLAQVYGIPLSLAQQASVVFMSVLAGVGTAGVPGGSLPMIVLVLQSVGIPAEGIGIILGVDRLLDMCRTTLNVTGDLVIAQVVARLEGAAGPAEGPN